MTSTNTGRAFARSIAAMALIGTALNGAASAGASLRLEVPDPAGSSVGRAATRFPELVAEKTDGKVTIKVFPDGVLSAATRTRRSTGLARAHGDFNDPILRTPNNALFEALGANPTPMALSKVHPALQLRAVDGRKALSKCAWTTASRKCRAI